MTRESSCLETDARGIGQGDDAKGDDGILAPVFLFLSSGKQEARGTLREKGITVRFEEGLPRKAPRTFRLSQGDVPLSQEKKIAIRSL